jgi:sialate O-acetylesterase
MYDVGVVNGGAFADNVTVSVGSFTASRPLSVCSLFSDHMVLQRGMDVPVWGHLTPGELVTVKLDGVQVAEAEADSQGFWLARIGAHSADGGAAHTLLVSAAGESDIQINDVVFGDVYLASGQSNMARTMDSGITAYEQELAGADAYPLIRQVAVSEQTADTEQTEPVLRSSWAKCSTVSLPSFSATGYFFAKNVFLNTGVPVGLLFSAWGGQGIQRFLSPAGMASIPELSGVKQQVEQGDWTGTWDIPHYDIYNTMIAPLAPYGLRGAIWYQGEANRNDGDIYRYRMKALMNSWRQKWGQGDFPFYYVQLADYEDAPATGWPEMRDVQRRTVADDANCGMAVAVDIGGGTNIHPENKQDVGARLAVWALAKDLGKSVRFSGPLYHEAIMDGTSAIRIVFDHVNDGLMIGRKSGTNQIVAVPDGPLENFEIAGTDKVFRAAMAWIDLDTVVVSNAQVAAPAYVRYCYTASPSGSNKLYNTDGLPASPFRTDKSFILTVKFGTGSGTLIPGQKQTIVATNISGKVFDRWIGATSELADLNAATTEVTMPDHGLYLLATYRDAAVTNFTLNIVNGYGSGRSQSGVILNIGAFPAPDGQRFDRWTGDVQSVTDIYADQTTLRMPSSNITLTALYRVDDSVGDGISNEWRSLYFGAATNGQSSALSDPDADGMNNLQEYIAGTSPIDNQSVLRLARSLSGGKRVFAFSSRAGKRYRLEKTISLIQPAWQPVQYNIIGDGMEKQFRIDTGSDSNCYYRCLLRSESL